MSGATGYWVAPRAEGPRAGSRVAVVHARRNPLTTLRELGRLESVARFDGLGEVVVGVDLEELRGADVVIADDGVVHIVLPPPRVLRVRTTTERDADGERRLTESARRSGMLGGARESAKRTVEAVVRAIGSGRNVITFRAE